MHTISDVIKALGGPVAAGKALALPPTTVSSWATRGSIPAKYWNAIIKASRGRVTAKTLLTLNDPAEEASAPVDGEAAA